MITEAVVHAGLGGMALALLVGQWWAVANQMWCQEIITGLFCVATALLIGFFSRREVTVDSAIGIFLVGSVAVGVVMLFARQYMSGGPPMPLNIENVLFGKIDSVGILDVWLIGIVAVAVFGIVFLMLPSFVYSAMDEEMARVNGIRTGLVHVLLLVMVSAVVTVAARMVGTLMINALMIIPGATAKLISRRFGGVLAASLLVGVLGVSGALVLNIVTTWASQQSQEFAWVTHVPTGPVLVLTLFAIFLAVWGIRKLAIRADEPARSGRARRRPWGVERRAWGVGRGAWGVTATTKPTRALAWTLERRAKSEGRRAKGEGRRARAKGEGRNGNSNGEDAVMVPSWPHAGCGRLRACNRSPTPVARVRPQRRQGFLGGIHHSSIRVV